MKIAALALLIAFETLNLSAAWPAADAPHFDIQVLSARPELVTGGDVLVRAVPRGRGLVLHATLNGRDVTSAFTIDRRGAGPGPRSGDGSYLAMLTALVEGEN